MISPAITPQARPTMIGTITGRSIHSGPKIALGLGLPLTSAVWAKLMQTIAVRPTTEPDDRSIPPNLITWVTPSAMTPVMATCSRMTFTRCSLNSVGIFSCMLNRKLPPFIRLRISNTRTIPINAIKMFNSGGRVLLVGSYFRPPRPCDFGDGNCAMVSTPRMSQE